MRLSEAMRLGAMLKGQAFNASYGQIVIGGVEVELTCAMAAAMDAIGQNDGKIMPGEEEVRAAFPITRSVSYCPQCFTRVDYLVNLVIHLNDEHEWTRERIADWLQPLEEAWEQQKPIPSSPARPLLLASNDPHFEMMRKVVYLGPAPEPAAAPVPELVNA